MYELKVLFETEQELQDYVNRQVSPKDAEAIEKLSQKVDEQTAKLEELIKKSYHAGDDDVGGKLHKDIKDSDLLLKEGEVVNAGLLAEVLNTLIKITNEQNGDDRRSKQIIYNVTGDYELKPIYNDTTLNRLLHDAEDMLHRVS